MKPFSLRHHVERAWKAAKRFWKQKPQRPSTAFDEMLRGSAIGLTACALIAAGLGSPDTVILGAGLFGVCAGALIGLLLWIGDNGSDDDPVVPPGRGRRGRPDGRHGPPGA